MWGAKLELHRGRIIRCAPQLSNTTSYAAEKYLKPAIADLLSMTQLERLPAGRARLGEEEEPGVMVGPRDLRDALPRDPDRREQPRTRANLARGLAIACAPVDALAS
jgi:hypothetical protein